VRLYGSENKRNNVTKTIQSAFKEGVNEPINNTTIESIINDVKTPISAPKHVNTNQFTCNDYLSNNRNLVDEVKKSITTHKNTIITAPTGSGKTTLFTKISNEINKSFVFLVPLRTIAEQSKHPYILGETPPEQIKLNLNHKLVFSTYGSAHKLGSYKGKIVVIDESHLLSDRANIYYPDIKTILKIYNEAESVVWLSATTNKILCKTLQDVNTITATKAKKPLQVQPLTYNPKKSKQADAVIKWITSQKEGKNVVFWNDKEKLYSIKKDLIKLGIYKAEEIGTYTANTSDTNNETYNELVENSTISNRVKIILATSKIGEGVNVNNTDIFNVLFVGNKDVNHFTQSLGRFRQSLAINCSCLFSFGFIEQKAKAINEAQLYSDMLNVVSQSANMFFEITEQKQPTIKIDWTEHATILGPNGKQIVNIFELLHQIKKVKESYYNLETWQRDIIELMPEVSFNQYKLIEQSKNNDLDNSRKARKEQKSKFLEEVREQLKTDNAGAILHEIRETTKNTHLKSFIDEVIYDMPISELDTNNKILLYEYYDNIENYVSQIKQLMNIIGLLNYSDLFNNTANLFNDNYKQSDYNNLVKRIYASNLKTNGAQSYEEAKSIESLKRIKNAFKPYLIDGKATIKREEVFKILRRNLHYRFRQETKAVLIEKIGSLFDVDYCKNTKSFILDEVSIKDYQRIKFIYNKTKNLVSSQTHNGKELQSVFNPLN
jgi:energy-coupling factor transporter ATP-binding protein EcfA2